MAKEVTKQQMRDRVVAFRDGRAIAAGCPATIETNCDHKVVFLPTDHYDFLGPVDVVGKTEDEILAAVKEIK